jgi:hypothetical protein
MELDPFDFMQGLSGKIAFSAVWATDKGHVFDDEKMCPLSIAS